MISAWSSIIISAISKSVSTSTSTMIKGTELTSSNVGSSLNWTALRWRSKVQNWKVLNGLKWTVFKSKSPLPRDRKLQVLVNFRSLGPFTLDIRLSSVQSVAVCWARVKKHCECSTMFFVLNYWCQFIYDDDLSLTFPVCIRLFCEYDWYFETFLFWISYQRCS